MRRANLPILMTTMAVFAAVVLAGSTQAAIPPLSLAELRDNADLIVTGTVTDVKIENVTVDFGSETHLDSRYIIFINVESVQKGNADVAKLQVQTWRPKSRPDGFTGPQGQNYIPSKGERARFYCVTVEGGQGGPQLLEPNGVLKFGNPGKGKDKQ